MSELPKMTFHLNDYYFKAINEMLLQAYYHGGDMGGPYGSNLDGLSKAMRNFLALTGARYVIIRDFGGCLQFARLLEEADDGSS